MVFPYLFNIYSLVGKFERTIKIVTECSDFIDFSKEDIVGLIVQAQVIKQEYDPKLFANLSEYEKIKYEAFYHAQLKDFEKVYELLLPAIEGDYSNDKLLQLSLLSCLQELDRFDDYIYYYKRFMRDETDEVIWFNYIEYLHKKEQTEAVINEIRKIMKVVENVIIINELLQLLLKYNLTDELDEYFAKIDSGEYPVLEKNMSQIIFHKLMYYLKKVDYETFYEQYEKLNLNDLQPLDRCVLTVNYYICKGDISKCGESYFKLFKVSKNHNDMLKAVEFKINANEIPVAEYYIEYINPMELERPEYYYMYFAIILEERGKLKEAFEKLDEYKEYVQDDLESPYHQFYTRFNMSNGRTNEAVKYMVEYNIKNPNPSWFKTIKYSENESGDELLKKMEELVGEREDINQINHFFNLGFIGISVYKKLTGKKIDEMIYDNRYPFSKLHISNGDVNDAKQKSKELGTKLLVDVNTLIVLAKANGLNLLDAFDEIFISYDSITILKQKERDIIENISPKILEYIEKALHVKVIPVDVRLKFNGEKGKLLPEDTLNCIALSEELTIPFLNVEISIYREFRSNYVVDLNVLLLYLKNTRQDLHKDIAVVKMNLKRMKFEFISFDAVDIVTIYERDGFEGVKSFVAMGKSSNYSTFVQVYMQALVEIKKLSSKEEFEKIASYFIRFFDNYLGKTRYYLSNIARDYLMLSDEIEYVMNHCSLLTTLHLLTNAHICQLNASVFFKVYDVNEFRHRLNWIKESDKCNEMLSLRNESIKLLRDYQFGLASETLDFSKIKNIMSAFAQFIIQFLSTFGIDQKEFTASKKMIEKSLTYNTMDDINYIVVAFEELKKEQEKLNITEK
jgi:hypothetical protein